MPEETPGFRKVNESQLIAFLGCWNLWEFEA